MPVNPAHHSMVANYWGKARPDENLVSKAIFHPLLWHMLDVAATAKAMLRARPILRTRLASMLGLEPNEAEQLLVWLAAIHDLGKFARPFQSKVPELWREKLQGLAPSNVAYATHHDGDGCLVFGHFMDAEDFTKRVWPNLSPKSLCRLANATFCHHGSPTAPAYNDVEAIFGPGLHDAALCLDVLTGLLLPSPFNAQAIGSDQFLKATYLVAGFVTTADWLGSSQTWFPYEEPHDDIVSYWEGTQHKAAKAVAGAGYAAARPSIGQTFASLTGKQTPPTPLQDWALTVELPAGPSLFVLEDVTGAGKTEAAHILIHRLMAAGQASGAYWAMPTMATANAMYARQSKMLSTLYDREGPRPSLALAHGKVALHETFQTSKITFGADEEDFGRADADLPASAACQAFLADDKRLSLLADIGAGTIDQALLAVLPSRFNTVRLLGLCEKVLVIDEAHAYDTFVGTELERLLEFHRANGGSAIVLSATLPNKQRHGLVAKWQGLGPNSPQPLTDELGEKRYPLATVVSSDAIQVTEIKPSSWSRRSLPVKLLETPEDILAGLAATVRAGGCAAWVRNSVDDVLVAAQMARAIGLEPLVFHARFAQGDRQAIEQGIMARFGPDASEDQRKGQLVIATQVIEQSLDIDFDQLASDIAPIDLIVQRAGRMRRHPRKARPLGTGTELLVLCPSTDGEPDERWIKSVLPGTAAVYRNHGILWRTATQLKARGALVVPDDLRALIEAVYASTDCPPALLKSSDEAEGKGKGQMAVAKNQLLELHKGYTPSSPYESELKIQTRDAEDQVIVRLARRNSAGKILPWYEDASLPVWQAWALSEVRASKRLVPLGAVSLPELAGDLTPIIAKWGRFEREIPVCVLEAAGEGSWRGGLEKLNLCYSTRLGLFC